MIRRNPRVGSLAAELPIAIVEPDGLIVTTDGRYVRLIQCDRVPNAITADASQLARITDAFAALCRIIPDRQSLTIYAQTDPVPIEDALAADEHATRIAARYDREGGHDVPGGADRAQLRPFHPGDGAEVAGETLEYLVI